jgi:Asp-tRNA(Asn)/Glu-tRNA(Gln) amidotransferase A subunit family amidase
MSHPGPTTNPFHAGHTPGGSSSGSAAAVGACMVPAAIGTQVVGSVIRPAGFCANHALKPTLGAIHRGERLSFSQSHIGVHAGSLADMWRVAIEVARRCGGDPGHLGLFGGAEPRSATKPHRLILIEAEGWADVDDETRSAFRALLAAIRGQGVEVIGRADHPLVEALEQAIGDSLALCRDICAYELRWTLKNLVEQHGGGLSDSMMARFELAQTMGLDDYRLALQRRDEARRALSVVAAVADGMISLSSVGPAPEMTNAGMDSGVSHTTGLPAFNAWTSLTGAPAITLPLLAVRGLPVGVQLIGQHHGDHQLTGIARWLGDLSAA